MKHVTKLVLGLALLLAVSISFAQDYSAYNGRTINIQPLIPYTGLQTDDTNRTINASQTSTYDLNYGQNAAQSISVQYQYKISELEARIAQLEQTNIDSQNRIASLETASNSLANQIAALSQNTVTTPPTNTTIPSTSTPPSSGSSYLQVGAFSRMDLAGQLVYKLQQLGYQVYDSSSNGVTKLFVGPYTNSNLPSEQYKLSLQNIRDSFPIAAP